ncbi:MULTISPECIES: ABC transporter substrate-binding protein [Clostridium]|uniref:NitT/TauT family transport system substrate-binding protein n=1 Tax=Clostridium cadaveris TaxID=1529 RepID=A0A1I2K8R0_9CLOT|nr:ABC transporter substrate-binding protein [Clostridium cadaveris]MDU4950913.1 ABC transporter substrate-binding protein [Clostridium sp.]MDM8310846.1 ABC transporter substrate-binding protein [Clostridium cadaveris]NME63338.1 ABC transporter substrate-binding protein [Clostridium cadaveris]NWK11463.1 ABC transporter substrate-binding protein [Clostridium cadaveris]SFF61597.1 NitT/TauT family transport system substrate-binding protein [Clostridium cadaveris]
MRKKISTLLLISLIISSLSGCVMTSSKNQKKEEEVAVKITALKGPTGMGIAKMISDEKNKEDKKYDINIANSIDEITPKLVNKEIDIAAVPSNLASILYNNNGGEIKTLAVNTLGVLYIVENGNTVNNLEDLKGKTIYSSGKGATPEYALNYVLKENGINPDKDLKIEYKSEHTECLSALLNDKNGIALLPQPFVTIALTKNENLRVALDLTKEWDALNKDKKDGSALITGVVVARKEFIDKYPQKVKNFLEEYKKSVDFTNNNIEEASKLIGENGIVQAEVAKMAIPKCNITFIDGKDMKDKLSGYLKVLYDANQKSVGGKMPSDDFYYIEKN